jgi:hypothetical protein
VADDSRIGGDKMDKLLAKYGLPGGIAIGGLFALLIAGPLDSELLGLLGIVALFVGVVVTWRTNQDDPKALPGVPLSITPVPDPLRRERLQQYLSQNLMATRGRVESVTDYSAVVVDGQRVNHILHLLISLLLCGLWLPVWFLIAVSGGEKRRVVTVDPCGNILAR